MSKNEATIISLQDLMNGEIGETTNVASPKEVAEVELIDAISGDKKEDLLGLGKVRTAEEIQAEKIEEEVEIEAKKVAEETEAMSKKDVHSTSSDFYKETLTNMFGDEISHIVQENEDGEEVEMSIANIDIDKELFKDIVSSKLASNKEEASKDKISLKGVSSTTRDLIEIDKNGGDITSLLRAKEEYQDPLDNLDITTVEGKRLAIYLRMKATGSNDDSIQRLIASYESEGKLEEYANTSEQELRAGLKQQVENAKAAALKKADEDKELMKRYKKDVKVGLEDFQMNDTLKNKIVALATKTDDKGRFEIDKAYKNLMEDPKTAARLALFLLDESEFIKQVTNKEVTKAKLTTARKLRVVSKASDGAPTLQGQGHQAKDGIIDIGSLK